jgi:16S rRNA (uracil1498-N3)-methyltransferase
MRISRLFVESALSPGSQINLDEQARHYIATVLRLKKDAELTVFNGSGDEFSGRLVEINRKTTIVEIESVCQPLVESQLQINFGLAISRSERMDFAIQKSVELGVNRITPLLTERCVVQLKGDKKHKKIEHWQKIARHAAEQSGRTRVPAITPIILLSDWLEQQQGLKVFLDPYAQATLTQLEYEQTLVTLLSGPEGGFSEAERKMALAHGFHAIKLGPRILRTETAALAAIASIQTLWGDFN